jgi:hypothetical protein
MGALERGIKLGCPIGHNQEGLAFVFEAFNQ